MFFMFLYGLWNCIGWNLVWVEMLIIVVNVFKDYDIVLLLDCEWWLENVDEKGNLKLLFVKCFIVLFLLNLERDCCMMISRCRDLLLWVWFWRWVGIFELVVKGVRLFDVFLNIVCYINWLCFMLC